MFPEYAWLHKSACKAASVYEQGKVVQALQCAQRHQLKTISPESFLVKAAATGEPNRLQYMLSAFDTAVKAYTDLHKCSRTKLLKLMYHLFCIVLHRRGQRFICTYYLPMLLTKSAVTVLHCGSCGLAGDLQVFTAVYRVCQQAAQPSIEPYYTCKQRFELLLQPATSKA